jgi:hypothetical protein
MAIPNWMTNGKIWQVTTTSESGVAMNDGVSFDTSSPSTILVKIQGTPWGTLDPSLIATTDTTHVTGSTNLSANPPGQPFHIDYVNGALQCYLDDASTQRHVKTGGTGRTAVTASPQAMARIVTGQAVGAGSTPATASSQVNARVVASQDVGGGSTPTWVASDPGSGRGIIKPGPHPRVGATPEAARA